MRRFYQEGWQGIVFTAFTHLSFFRLASSKFYATFYEELFKRYGSWNDLPSAWRENKEQDAKWVAGEIVQQRSQYPEDDGDVCRVLSIGSGVGFMEKVLLELIPDMELHVNEPSTAGMRWLRQIIPNDRIYIGSPLLCLPPDISYNVIYLSTVDYSIPTRELVRLLEALGAQLKPGGKIVCLSASLLEEESLIGSFVNGVKIIIRCLLHYTGLRRQQFWGWRRTRDEYRDLFQKASLAGVDDGFVDDMFSTYFIKGGHVHPLDEERTLVAEAVQQEEALYNAIGSQEHTA